jgi:hypothetical protein
VKVLFFAQIFIQNVLVKIAIEDSEFLDGIDHLTDCRTLQSHLTCFAQPHSLFKYVVLTIIHALLFPVTRLKPSHVQKIYNICTSNSNNSNIYIKKITATVSRFTDILHPHKTRMHKPHNNITRQQEQIPEKSWHSTKFNQFTWSNWHWVENKLFQSKKCQARLGKT